MFAVGHGLPGMPDMTGFFSRGRQQLKSIAVQPARENLRWRQTIFFFKAGPRLKRLDSDRVFAVARNWPQASPFETPLDGRFIMHLAESIRGYTLTRCLRHRPTQSKHHQVKSQSIFAPLLRPRCQGIGEPFNWALPKCCSPIQRCL